ncbi:MAG: phytanoyl-CoA dioxygenase family protein [Polyangiales bacterium]
MKQNKAIVIDEVTDLGNDLARTHRATASRAAEEIPIDVVEADLAAVERDGYVIIPSILDRAEVAEIKGALSPFLGHVGRNNFEGHKTQRLYAVLEKTRTIDRLVEHPRILALLDRMFLPNYLLSQAQVINILPGEQAQHLHPDDGFYRTPRPRPPLGAATVWAIDEFTEENGATTLVPGSHKWSDDRVPGSDDPTVQAVMPPGSVAFYPGTTWHGGGENRSTKPRFAVTCQYCEPYLRTQENFFLAISRDTVRNVSEDIRRMLGYSIHPPFIGMVDGMHPRRVLEQS